MNQNRPRLNRPCRKCQELFNPSSKFQRICNRCAGRGLYVPKNRFFRRPCKSCGNTFSPTGPSSKTCDACLELSKVTQIKNIKASIKKKREMMK